jgi:hypothetical protein
MVLPFGPPFTTYIWKLNHGLYMNDFAQVKNFIVKKKEDRTTPPPPPNKVELKTCFNLANQLN